MIKFLANTIDQLDFALDHLILQDINYKRLSLVLIDNVMELTLHSYAEQKQGENRWRQDNPVNDPKIVTPALGRNFDAKVKLAKVGGLIDEEMATSITTLHNFRNQLYHRGIMHEEILPSLALFYFRVACDVLARFEPFGYGWGSSTVIPHRAVKYIGKLPMNHPDKVFPAAWKRLREVSEAIPFTLAQDLHNHMLSTVKEIDRLIDYIAKGAPERMTRDEVVIDAQAWGIAFTSEGQDFAKENGCPVFTVGGYVRWLKENFPWTIKSDPIKSWRKRLSTLETEKSEHKALSRYIEFMNQTEDFREAVEQSAGALDQHAEEQMGR